MLVGQFLGSREDALSARVAGLKVPRIRVARRCESGGHDDPVRALTGMTNSRTSVARHVCAA